MSSRWKKSQAAREWVAKQNGGSGCGSVLAIAVILLIIFIAK